MYLKLESCGLVVSPLLFYYKKICQDSILITEILPPRYSIEWFFIKKSIYKIRIFS